MQTAQAGVCGGASLPTDRFTTIIFCVPKHHEKKKLDYSVETYSIFGFELEGFSGCFKEDLPAGCFLEHGFARYDGLRQTRSRKSSKKLV